jgi:hypothetical protein
MGEFLAVLEIVPVLIGRLARHADTVERSLPAQ